MSTQISHHRRVSIVAVLGMVLALFAWMLPGDANALSEDPSGPQVASVAAVAEEPNQVEPEATDSEDADPAEAGPAEELTVEDPAPVEEPNAVPESNEADTPVQEEPVGEDATEDAAHDDFVPSNPDHLPEGYEAAYTGIDYNVFPATEFASNASNPMPRAMRMARSAASPVIGTDHPQNPGDVLLFKEAKPVDGMVNTWDVTLRVEGKDKPTTSDVVLVIDTSGSMKDYGRMQAAKDAANAFVDKLLPSDNTRIGVASFASNANALQPLTNDPADLRRKINSLRADGGTFTQAGVRQARAMLQNSDADNKHIVLLSDGEPTFSYKMRNPDNYLQPYGRYSETTSGAPESEYTTNRVGDGSRLRTWVPAGWSSFYYNHGNSAIAEAGFAGADGSNVWTVGLQTDNVGSGILRAMKQGSGSFTEVTDVDQLKPVFEQIAGAIGAAVRDAAVSDPMGTGFEIPVGSVDNITSVPTNTATYQNGTLTWRPGTLETPINEGSDIKYAELKYRVSINDDILNVESEDGKYSTNGDATLDYTDAEGRDQTVRFPVPLVEPTLYTVQKILLDEMGNEVKEDKDFNVRVTGPGSDEVNPYPRDLTVNPSGQAKRVITDLRIEGEYTLQEDDYADYTTTYTVNGGEEVEGPVTFTARTGQEHKHEIVVTNRPAVGVLEINKALEGDATDKAGELTYTGSYVCKIEGRTTAEGTWSVTGAGKATLTPAEGSVAADKIPVKSECTVTENPVQIEDDSAKFYSVGEVNITQPAKVVKNQTSTATVTNTLTKNLGSVTWTKVGEGANQIGGSEWNLKGPGLPEGGKSIEDVNRDGQFGEAEGLKDLKWGEYTLVETLAPAGYIVDKTEHKFTVGDLQGTDGLNIDLGKITNSKVVAPNIPLTGGLSRDAFLLGGGILTTLGLMVYGAYAIRRRAN